MNGFQRAVLLVGGGCLLGGFTTLTQPRLVNAAAPSSVQSVRVVNAQSEALPIAGHVAIANAPGGSLTEPFAWWSHSVPMKTATSYCNNVTFVVPAGKLLVIEHVSVTGAVTPGGDKAVFVNAKAAPAPASRSQIGLPITVSGDGAGTDLFVASQAARIYAHESSEVIIYGCNTAAVLGDYFEASVSGYLINAT